MLVLLVALMLVSWFHTLLWSRAGAGAASPRAGFLVLHTHFCEAVLVLVLLALVLVFWFHTLLWYAPRRGLSSHVPLPTIQARLTLAKRQKAV